MMRQRELLPAIWGLVALLLILGAVMFWLNPATKRLDNELLRAQDELPRLSTELERRVGENYGRDLHGAYLAGERAVEGIEGTLRQQGRLLSQWFPRMKLTAEGIPTRDGFKAQYTFYQDELRRELSGIARARRGHDILAVPLLVPDFLKEDRAPKDEAEMRRYQRIANLEYVLLKAAGQASAFPYAAMEVRQGWQAASGDSAFQESRVLLRLEVPPQNLPDALRALCELGGDGPIVEIEALTTRPKPLPRRMEPSAVPVVQADIRLVLSTYRE